MRSSLPVLRPRELARPAIKLLLAIQYSESLDHSDVLFIGRS